MDPELLTALTDYHKYGRRGLNHHKQKIGIISIDEHSKPVGIPVFLHCDPRVNLKYLSRYNTRVYQPGGRVRTAFLPLTSLEALSEDRGIERINASRYLPPMVDQIPQTDHLAVLDAAAGLTGKGVLVGIVDTGIDALHQSFRRRILRIWDQTLSGPGVCEGAYGLELTPPNLPLSQDRNGHGTCVAGIAAGLYPEFPGLAVSSDLLVVKTDFMNAHIADAIRYIFRVAGELDRPAVVNLSLGTQDQAPDAIEDLTQIVEDESGAGRIVCCSEARSPMMISSKTIAALNLPLRISSGRSQTTSFSSGLIALLLETDSQLTPPDIRRILFNNRAVASNRESLESKSCLNYFSGKPLVS